VACISFFVCNVPFNDGFCCLCGIMPSGKDNIVATIAGDESDVKVDEDISNVVTISASYGLRD